MLDAIFKEDIESINKDLILTFVSKNKPTDTQLLISIAEAKDKDNNINVYNQRYFDNKAKLIPIGDGILERAFLTKYNDNQTAYLYETLSIINGAS